MTGKLADARRTLQIAFRYYDELERLGAQLIRRADERGASSIGSSRGSCPLPTPRAGDGDKRSRGHERRARRARRSAAPTWTTADLDAIRGTRWGALQAVTAYHDHHATIRRTAGRSVAEARFERATAAAPLKDRALALLLA